MRRAGIPAIFELAAGERARESWAEIDTGVEWRGRVGMEVEGGGSRWLWRGWARDDFVQRCNNGMDESWEGAGGGAVLLLARSMDGSGQVNSSSGVDSSLVGRRGRDALAADNHGSSHTVGATTLQPIPAVGTEGPRDRPCQPATKNTLDQRSSRAPA
jgi:hypothetical protein